MLEAVVPVRAGPGGALASSCSGCWGLGVCRSYRSGCRIAVCVGLVHGTLCVVHGRVRCLVRPGCTHVCPLSSHLFSLARQARARFRRVVLENLRVTRENNAQVVISRAYRAYLHRRGVNQEKLLYVAAQPVLGCYWDSCCRLFVRVFKNARVSSYRGIACAREGGCVGGRGCSMRLVCGGKLVVVFTPLDPLFGVVCLCLCALECVP